MKVLGIDQSLTSTGLCLMEEGKVIALNIYKTTPDKDDPSRIYHRIRYISGKVHAYINEYDVDRIVIEDLAYCAKGNATRDLAMLLGAIVRVCSHVPIHLPPTALKKYATGKGNSDKKAMLEAIREVAPKVHEHLLTYPASKGRYDLADAFWLAHYGTHYGNQN